ncbi:MAG TPA: hydantoinase/oxoprolinase family protein [Solirubrobacteraceae bacterium]|nr:hydantoinase/oxoprolinase family protein [Solirubrobacteraceae bacterium]
MSSGATIDVDIGGTFTDCFVRLPDARVAAVKTPTTGYRLAVGFMRALTLAAEELGRDVDRLLAQTHEVRYSTTVAMNTLLQRLGPKLGLITTEGFTDVLQIARGASWTDSATNEDVRNVARIDKPEPLVPAEMTVGARERIDCFGAVVMPLDEEHFLVRLRELVDQGARGFVVALLFSYVNPVHERRIRELIEREYPESYLGAMPVMLSCEVLPKRWEYTRTNTTVLNAYLHQAMWEELSGMNDELREHGYTRGIMMVHNTGGMAEVYRTSAVETYNGGPVAGLIGSAALGQDLGFGDVIVADMGGTSFDIGLIVHGQTRFYQFKPVIDRYWVDMSILETRSIGAGGGSIAHVNAALANRLAVGPRGAGSMPGPACYGLGGTEPTVTDADVVLGYIDPDRYFDGKIRLRPELAEKAIRGRIAEPLGIDVIEAAARIRALVDANMADVISRETLLRGYQPRDFTLFAYGGAGPTHATGFGRRLGCRRIVIFPYSPVFCAFGSSTMPVAHIYEASRRLDLLAPGTQAPLSDYESFNQVVQGLRARAEQDLTGEGYDASQATYTLELEMKYGGQIHIHRITSPLLLLSSQADVLEVYQRFEREYAAVFSEVNVFPAGGAEVHNFILRAEMPPPQWSGPNYEPGDGDAAAARVGERPAWFSGRGFVPSAVYAEPRLTPDTTIEGPALIQSRYTTVVVDPDCSLVVDGHRNLIISVSEGSTHDEHGRAGRAGVLRA